jgi:hypothetical protein
MKSIRLQFLALITILSGVTVACSIDSDSEPNCFSAGYEFTSAVTGPDSTKVNVPITINVSFQLQNSCGVYKNIGETNGFPKYVAPYVEYNGCECTPTVTTLTKPYTFTAPTVGRYELRFTKDAQQQYLTKTIVVTAQ